MSPVPPPARCAILHVALNPVTGVWSVMRELSKAQAATGLYAAVGLGVITDRQWPALYATELQNSGLPHYRANTPKMFGTGQFLWQLLCPPPIDAWVDDLLARSGAPFCVVHFHNAWLSGVFLPLHNVQSGRARVVATVHGVNANFTGKPVRQAIQRWLAARLPRHGATLTSVDAGNLVRARTLLHLPPELFTVIPNGIVRTSAQARTRPAGAVFTVGHISSIEAGKGWRLLVEAASRLRSGGLAINVVLAGRGSEAAVARELARQSGGWLTFKDFIANPRELLMPELDALVLMSDQEGLPMAIIEALSIGLPVIATPVGGVPEAVRHQQNGLLIPRTVDALVAALQRLAGDESFSAALRAQARLDFVERFEISKIVSAYDSVYHQQK